MYHDRDDAGREGKDVKIARLAYVQG